MPLLKNINKNSSPITLLAAHVVKLKFRLENTLSWSVTSVTLLQGPAISSSIVLSTSLWTILEHLALTMDRDPPWCYAAREFSVEM